MKLQSKLITIILYIFTITILTPILFNALDNMDNTPLNHNNGLAIGLFFVIGLLFTKLLITLNIIK